MPAIWVGDERYRLIRAMRKPMPTGSNHVWESYGAVIDRVLEAYSDPEKAEALEKMKKLEK